MWTHLARSLPLKTAAAQISLSRVHIAGVRVVFVGVVSVALRMCAGHDAFTRWVLRVDTASDCEAMYSVLLVKSEAPERGRGGISHVIWKTRRRLCLMKLSTCRARIASPTWEDRHWT